MAKTKSKPKTFTVDAAQARAMFVALTFSKAAVDGWDDARLTSKLNKLGQLTEDGKTLKDKKLNALLTECKDTLEAGGTITVAAAAGGKKGKPAADAKPAKGKGKAKPAADDEDDDSDDADDEEEEDDEDSEDADEDDDSDDDEEDADDSDDEDDGDEDGDDEEDSDEDDEDSDDDGDEDADDEDADTDSDEDEDESDEEEDEDDDVDEKPKKGKGKTPPAKDKKSKGKAKGEAPPKKVGVVQCIVDALTAATEQKPVTKKGILAKLVKKFPDRDEDGMETTINVQVPNRLKTEKGLNIVKNEKGYYIAAGKVKAKKPKK